MPLSDTNGRRDASGVSDPPPPEGHPGLVLAPPCRGPPFEESPAVAHNELDDPPRALTVSEARSSLRLSKDKFYELLAAGEIESFKIGRSRRVVAESLDRYITRQLSSGAA